MTAPMDSPRPATTKLHRKLKDRMYRHAEKHGITGFEAAGVMFALAAEVMASALVREGLLQGGPDFAEEGEDATDALAASDALADMMPDLQTTINHLVGDTQWLSRRLDKMTERCTDLTEANDQLEEALRGMAELQREMREELSRAQKQVIACRDCAHGRIAQLEHALQLMAELAQGEIKKRQAQLAETVIYAANAQEQSTKEREVLRESHQLADQATRIDDLLKRYYVTLPTQEPQS